MQITLDFKLSVITQTHLINPYFHIYKSPQEEQNSIGSGLFFRDLPKLVSADGCRANQPGQTKRVILRLTEDGGGGAWR